jgi:uncharacterized protein YjbI with pentapeptide repeats
MHDTSFYAMNLEHIQLNHCDLKGSDFTGITAINASFPGCNFTDVTFDESDLSGADFTTSTDYRINPLKNRIKKAKFSVSGLYGLVSDFDIEVIGD